MNNLYFFIWLTDRLWSVSREVAIGTWFIDSRRRHVRQRNYNILHRECRRKIRPAASWVTIFYRVGHLKLCVRVNVGISWIVVFISLFIYTAALRLSYPSTVDHRYGVAVVSRRNRQFECLWKTGTLDPMDF